MSLVSAIRRNLHKEIVASFATSDAGDLYRRNGYDGIARALYGHAGSALSSAALLGGIKIISEDIGSLSLVTLQRSADRSERTPAYDHPLYGLLHDSPNPDMTAMQFREALTANALLTGSGYAQIERLNGRIIALWPWQPQEVRVEKDAKGRRFYTHHESTHEWKTYAQRDVFKLSGFGLTGYDPLNLMETARKTLGLTIAQQEYAERFFSQDQTPNLVLEHPGQLGESGVAGVKDAWRKSRRGEDQWHTPAVLQEGMKATVLPYDMRKTQLVEQRAFQLLEVCRLIRLSPHKLADMGRATWANVEQLNINHYNETLRPWCKRWEETIKLRCLQDENDVYVKHNIADFLRGDFRTQTDGFARMLEKGVYSINEVRAFMDLNPVENGDGHYIQLNMQQVAGTANEIVDAQDEQAKSHARWLREVENDPALA
jgi:HK97 family phage portal protein